MFQKEVLMNPVNNFAAHGHSSNPMTSAANLIIAIGAACLIMLIPTRGGYDTRIYVEQTKDRKPYILEFSKGRLSIKPADEKPKWVFWGSPEQQRDGKVVLGSAEQAFSKGVPFYISAEFLPPDSLRITVTSNLAKRIDRATLFTAWNNPAGAGRMKDSGHVRSASQPQTLVVKDEDFKDTASISVWIREGEINKSNPFVDMPHCLISNEVEVKK
jgi:hypothetical protein